MSKAIYHQSSASAVELEVIATREGVVDLGHGETILVRNCPVSTEAKIGHAVLVVETPPVADDKDKASETDDLKSGKKTKT